MGGGKQKPWRKACEEALRDRSSADAIRFWGLSHKVDGEKRPVFDYRFEHTLAVVKIARWLAPKVGADPEVVECAAWLHDCAKRLKDSRSKDSHARDASELVPKILDGTNFPPEKIPAVRHAIEHHVGLRLAKKLEPLETACLWDSDKLSKIGAASIIHFTCVSGAFQPVDTAMILERGEKWLELARNIAISMNTEPARQEADCRLEFLERHYRQLRREWNEPMEETVP